MRRHHFALLAALLVGTAACSQDRNGMNHRDTHATDRAAQVTNGTDGAGQAGRSAEATGTTGSTATQSDAEGTGPDALITMKIQAAYAGDDVVKGRHIDVDTEAGVVTLTGEVDSRHERDAAEQLARQTDGVKRVVNQLTVASGR